MEFTLVMPLLLIMILALVEFGNLIQARLIVANVAREGGAIASRTLVIDAALAHLVAVSGHPLNLVGPQGRVYITRIDAGTTPSKVTPTLTTSVTDGGYGVGSSIGGGGTMGLPANLYQHLVYRTGRPAPQVDGSDIGEMTIVEVYYNYKPITPLFGFIPGLIPQAGHLLSSKAFY
jgi:TadE-like protein